MSSDQFMPQAPQDEAKAQEPTNGGEVGGGTSPSPQNESDNDSYDNQRHNCNDRRTDIRTADRHYSWREVHRAQHTEPGR